MFHFLPLIRGINGLFMILLGTAALISFGINMDKLNFPGANLKLKLDTEEDFVPAGRGFQIDVEPGSCSNAVTFTSYSTAFTTPLCIAENKSNGKWTHGWVVAPNCARVTNKPLECIDIGASNYVANFGIVTAIFAALHCLLSGVHTFNAIEEQAKEQAKNQTKTLPNRFLTDKRLHGFNIFWSIIGIGLCIISAYAWNGLCDKIDSGLGRTEQDVLACATKECQWSFGLIATFIAVTTMWFHLPHIAIWFKWVQSA